MTGLRAHLERLEAVDDLARIDERVHWDEAAAAVAAEAARNNGPAMVFERTPGCVRFVSGAFGGPDQLEAHDREPWDRIVDGLTSTDTRADPTYPYRDLLDLLAGERTVSKPDPSGEPAATIDRALDLHTLGLPTLSADSRPLVSLGVLAVDLSGTTTWVPVRGEIRGSSRLRLVVPAAFRDRLHRDAVTDTDDVGHDGADHRTGSVPEYLPKKGPAVSVVLGVSAPVLIAALQGWTRDRARDDVPSLAAGLAPVNLSRVDDRLVPQDAEVRIDGTATIGSSTRNGLSRGNGSRGDGSSGDESSGVATIGRARASWELTCETAAIDVRADRIALRSDPIVAFSPLGAPLADDIHLTSLVEAGQLYRRVNGYWGVSPVRWVRLPPEGGLGMCLVSSEILYAGFEWQLANTLFSFSKLFDKVLIVDEASAPADLAKAFDDMWVKAHPANDWAFSEPNAPSATAPHYRADGETGSRLHIAATWDPRWDEEYIAPRVTFERSFPENIRESVRERWDGFGLDRDR